MRICVVGGGAVGITHVETIARTEGFQIAGVADPSPAGEAVASANGTRSYADFRDLIAAERPQGAIIATPNALHVPIGTALLEAGIPILVEKPIANTVADGMELAACSAATGVPVLVGHHRRYHPAIRKARELSLTERWVVWPRSQ